MPAHPAFQVPELSSAVERLRMAGVESPRLEARILLAHVLGVSTGAILAGIHPPFTPETSEQFQDLVGKRCERVPSAYLTGEREFYGRGFCVSPAVLIPRPETEMLVEHALKAAAGPTHACNLTVADIGTGSGCIAVSMALQIPSLRVVATDISARALEVAAVNVRRHGIGGKLRLVEANGAECLAEERYDIVISNPPYIPAGDIDALQPEVAKYEPLSALSGGSDGLDIYRRIAPATLGALVPGGWLILEIGQGQAEAVAAILRSAGLVDPVVYPDLSGIPRVITSRRAEIKEIRTWI